MNLNENILWNFLKNVLGSLGTLVIIEIFSCTPPKRKILYIYGINFGTTLKILKINWSIHAMWTFICDSWVCLWMAILEN